MSDISVVVGVSQLWLSDQEWLHEQYVVARRSAREIASELGVSRGRVEAALRAADIQARGRGKRNRIQHPVLRDPSAMVELLVEERATLGQVATRLECGLTSVRRAVRRDPVASALRTAGWDMVENAAAAQGGRPAGPGPVPVERIVQVLDGHGPAGVRQVAERLEVDASSRGVSDWLRRRLNRLVSDGKVERVSQRPATYRVVTVDR